MFEKIRPILFILIFALAPIIAQAQSANQWQSGEQIYQNLCGYCHTPGVGPELGGRGLPYEYIRLLARNGMRAMPAFRPSELSDVDLDKIANYINAMEAQQ